MQCSPSVTTACVGVLESTHGVDGDVDVDVAVDDVDADAQVAVEEGDGDEDVFRILFPAQYPIYPVSAHSPGQMVKWSLFSSSFGTVSPCKQSSHLLVLYLNTRCLP